MSDDTSAIPFDDEPIDMGEQAAEEEVADPIELETTEGAGGESPAIRQFGTRKKVAGESSWRRMANADGTGATHVKTFYSKLRADALDFMDHQINEWLDAHPELEVKFATTTIGELTGKTKELALFVNVWV